MQLTLHPKIETCLTWLWQHSRLTAYFYQHVHFVHHTAIHTLCLSMPYSDLVLLYNPTFIDNTDTEILIGLFVHEMLHIFFNHSHRTRTTQDIFLQNLAQDMVVNTYMKAHKKTFFSRTNRHARETPELIIAKAQPCIPDAYIDETGITDPAWEQVYHWLKTKKQQHHDWRKLVSDESLNTGLPIEGKCSRMNLNDSDMETNDMQMLISDTNQAYFPENSQMVFTFLDETEHPLPMGMHLLQHPEYSFQIQSKLKRILNYAAQDEQCQMERQFNEMNRLIHEPEHIQKCEWKKKIKSMLDMYQQSNVTQFTTSRFNRRYFANGIYASGKRFKYQTVITVALDVSASMVMKRAELETAFGVIEYLCTAYRINLVCIDEHLCIPQKQNNQLGFNPINTSGPKTYFYQKGDWKHIQSVYQGMTFFGPLFNSYMKHHRETLLVITDGEIFDIDRLNPYSPTVWIVSKQIKDNFHPPFGNVVSMDSYDT